MPTNRRLLILAVMSALTTPVLSQVKKPQLTSREIAQRALPSVVALVMDTGRPGEKSYGSGFFVSSDVVATNFHVVEGTIGGYAKIVGQEAQYDVLGFVALDTSHDLALLKLKGGFAKPLSVGDSNVVAIGDEIFAVGNPKGLEGTFSQGIVSSIRKQGSDSLIQITAPISPGSSGGPVVNQSGDVIGVAVGSVRDGQALNFAIPIKYLKPMLNTKGEIISFGNLIKRARPEEVEPVDSPAGTAKGQGSPSLSTDDVVRSWVVSHLPREGAITELRINTPRREYVYRGDDCSFEQPTYYWRTDFDRTKDGTVDRLHLDINCVSGKVSVEFNTYGIGRNLAPGVYNRAVHASNSEIGFPGISIQGPGLGCDSSLRGSFQIFEVQFDYSPGVPVLISFGASFDLTCGGQPLSGTIYVNSLPNR
ncbi:MAG TPA: S1C family serine protease [Blastocatellia bacterium]|nr:S1C family serine protease [Blastocatellia bacterium]